MNYITKLISDNFKRQHGTQISDQQRQQTKTADGKYKYQHQNVISQVYTNTWYA